MRLPESGIDFLEQVKLEEIDNGYRFNIHFRILRKTGDPLKIKIDITKKENENILIPVQQKKILQMYSDGFDVRTAVYSLDEMFAEKIRALFERTRPRDLYDIWFLSTHATLDTTLLKKKCAIRNVTVDVKELLARQSKFERAWESSLRHQLNNLPDATIVFTEVIEFVKKHTFKN